MDEYNKLIGQIKLSEIRVASIAKEIKEYEGEIKLIEDEHEVMKIKYKQLSEELEYKKKIVREKQWELDHLNVVHNMWHDLLNEKQAILKLKKEELNLKQNKVWNTRTTFFDNAIDFITRNDFLSNGNTKIENVLRNLEEKNKLLSSVEALELKVTSIENGLHKSKANLDLIQKLEKERDTLAAFEQSQQVFSLQNQITNWNNELESLNKETSKFCERATRKPGIGFEIHFNSPTTDGGPSEICPFQTSEQNTRKRLLSSNEKKPGFVPKVSSFLITNPTFPDNTGTYKNIGKDNSH